MSECSISRYFTSLGRDIQGLCQHAGEEDSLRGKKIFSICLRISAITLVASTALLLIAAIACAATLSIGGIIAAAVLVGLIPFFWIVAHEIYVIGHNISALIKEQELASLSAKGGFLNALKDRIDHAGGVKKVAKEAWSRTSKNENPYVINTWVIRWFVPSPKGKSA